MDYIIEQIPNQNIVFMRRTGAYGTENISLMTALKKWAAQKGLFVNSTIYGIAQDNPANTLLDQCRYDVCLIVADFSSADEDVYKGESPSGKYAVFTIAHTAEAVQAFWGAIMNVLHENELCYDKEKPILERYKYRFVEEQKSEFCVPIV
jgi:DNA gyrase inhibitor GyrI